MPSTETSGGSDRGFTVLELLVAMSVLAILVVLVAQMLGSASTMASGGRKRMAADEEARMVFDRMTADFGRMVKRADVDSLFVGLSGNDEMYFYSEAPAIFSSGTNNSPVALIGYRVESNSLCRVGQGLNWEDIRFVTVGTNGATNTATLIATNALTNPVVLAPSVFRMEYAFLMKPGTTNTSGGTNGPNTFSKNHAAGMGLKDVSAVVVTLALLDTDSRKTVDSGTVSAAASQFGDSADGSALGDWSAAATTGLTGPARKAVRIYQRYIPITP